MATPTKTTLEEFIWFLLDCHDEIKYHLLLLVDELHSIMRSKCIAVMQLLKFSADGCLSLTGLQAEGLFEAVLCHGKVGHG